MAGGEAVAHEAAKSTLESHALSRSAELLGRWRAEALAGSIVVEASRRMSSSLGRAVPLRRRIRLHHRLLELGGSALFDEVLCHELAHLVAHERHGPAIRPHGREWRALMGAAGYQARARIPQDGLPPELLEPQPPFYRYRCRECPAQWAAKRRVTRWRCAVCVRAGRPGRLRIERVTRLAAGGGPVRS